MVAYRIEVMATYWHFVDLLMDLFVCVFYMDRIVQSKVDSQ